MDSGSNVFTASDWDAWDPCNTAFNSDVPGFMALVQSKLDSITDGVGTSLSPEEIWTRIAKCLDDKYAFKQNLPAGQNLRANLDNRKLIW